MGEDHEDESDVIDPAVEASDALLVEEVVQELEDDAEAESPFNLSDEDIELGRGSVTKVSRSETIISPS